MREYCCNKLKLYLSIPAENRMIGEYQKENGGFNIGVPNTIGSYELFNYCPFCGREATFEMGTPILQKLIDLDFVEDTRFVHPKHYVFIKLDESFEVTLPWKDYFKLQHWLNNNLEYSIITSDDKEVLTWLDNYVKPKLTNETSFLEKTADTDSNS